MKTREEQRKEILDSLEWFLLRQAEEEVLAKCYIAAHENDPDPYYKKAVESRKKTLKFGHWTPVWFLQKQLKHDLGLKPIRDDGHDVRLGLNRGGYRTYHYSWLVYSGEDEAKISTLIQRLTDQGYIKLSKSGKAFHVMRDKFPPVKFNDPDTGEIVTYDDIMKRRG